MATICHLTTGLMALTSLPLPILMERLYLAGCNIKECGERLLQTQNISLMDGEEGLTSREGREATLSFV